MSETNQGATDSGSENTNTEAAPQIEVVDRILTNFNPGEVDDAPVTDDVLRHAAPSVRKLIGQLRDRLLSAHDEKKLLEEKHRESEGRVYAERQRLSLLASPEFTDGLSKLQQLPADVDEWSPAGQEAKQRAAQAKMFEEMLAPVRKQLEAEQQKARVDAYVAANPDLKEPEVRLAVAKLLRDKPNLDLADAHEIVRGRRSAEESARLRAAQEAEKNARLKVTERSGGGQPLGQSAGQLPKFTDAWEAFKYLQARGKS